MGSINTYPMPFGKYKGMTLDQIAATNEGLLYLDWAADEFDGRAGEAISEYLSDPTIQQELRRLLDDA